MHVNVKINQWTVERKAGDITKFCQTTLNRNDNSESKVIVYIQERPFQQLEIMLQRRIEDNERSLW